MPIKYEPSDLRTLQAFVNAEFKNSDEVLTIFDIGSCHALESVEFSKIYKNAKIFAFEPNPTSYEVCLENTKEDSSIEVINKDIKYYNGFCKFYPMDKDKTITTWWDGNQGASSLYRANGKYPHETYVQYEIEVPCITLESFCMERGIQNIDVIWMDLQGAELTALKSMGDFLNTVKVIHTELEMNPMYDGQCLFEETHDFLLERGFSFEWGNTEAKFGSDFIFVKK